MSRLRPLAVVAVLALAATSPTSLRSQTSTDPKQARIELVREFVRELEVLYRLQQTAKTEFAQDPSTTGKLMTAVRQGTRTIAEMRTSIARLDSIAVDGTWAEIRTTLKGMHQSRIALVQEMTEGSKSLLSGPKPGVDYGTLVARAPELTAEVEQLDKLIFQMSQVLFFGLVDEGRLGADGKLHHLLITRKDRASMIRLINLAYGASLEDNNASYIVSSAWAIKYGLNKYKAADEN
jgi:hypothetical protein